MSLVLTVAIVTVMQAALWATHRYGEMDTFWYVAVLAVTVPLSLVAIFFAWIGSVDWR